MINAFVRNSKGELWIPRRASNKRIFPLHLDMSVGGHVESGETYEEAFKHELKEELNLDVGKVKLKFLGKLTPHQNKVSAFMKVYEIQLEKTPRYNKKDFVEGFWLKPKELLKRLKKGDKSKDDLPKLVRIFYLKKKK